MLAVTHLLPARLLLLLQVQLILPEALKLLPLYSLALHKSAVLRPDVRQDERALWLATVLGASCGRIMGLLHPRLFALHHLLVSAGRLGCCAAGKCYCMLLDAYVACLSVRVLAASALLQFVCDSASSLTTFCWCCCCCACSALGPCLPRACCPSRWC